MGSGVWGLGSRLSRLCWLQLSVDTIWPQLGCCSFKVAEGLRKVVLKESLVFNQTLLFQNRAFVDGVM